MPFYVVRQGRIPGIYNTWDECNKQVHRFTGAQFKKFDIYSDAQAYFDGKIQIQKTVETKATITKPKLANKIPKNLVKDSIRKFSAIKLTQSDENLTSIDHIYRIVYSDGCCFANGSAAAKAGYGVYWDDNHPWNISERLHGEQTNQRAELTAAIYAMETALTNNVTHLEIRTDSKYTIQSATEWIKGWKRSNWIKKTDSKPVMNKDLMIKIDQLQSKLQLKWTYVPGHSSNKGNDEADRLAKAGAQKQ